MWRSASPRSRTIATPSSTGTGLDKKAVRLRRAVRPMHGWLPAFPHCLNRDPAPGPARSITTAVPSSLGLTSTVSMSDRISPSPRPRSAVPSPASTARCRAPRCASGRRRRAAPRAGTTTRTAAGRARPRSRTPPRRPAPPRLRRRVDVRPLEPRAQPVPHLDEALLGRGEHEREVVDHRRREADREHGDVVRPLVVADQRREHRRRRAPPDRRRWTPPTPRGGARPSSSGMPWRSTRPSV